MSGDPAGDPVARLRVLAAGLHGAMFAERHIPLPYETVWAVAADLETELPYLVPGLREFRTAPGDSPRKPAVAIGVFGARDDFDVRLAPGWCLMQSGLIVGGMAARPDRTGTGTGTGTDADARTDAGTRFAVLGAARPPALAPAPWAYRHLFGRRRGEAFLRTLARRAAERA